ncbi:hypothetical protein SAMN02745181_3857 [Rubritalea squalenifaciens DSM 18772]|uniref:Uncharacterized protein n=1 Tax=Rubritalea squalenifaciens DSM 18772 TaxID=1123071 RepID=A0A1M6SQ90_9BACT|nr:hypothetical protein [Rubritalea squalenifaciens]SHK46748.1 hypothetical protein SAMN02745181_3857 [Rubritalea squalenifaciens DSM 18772]
MKYFLIILVLIFTAIHHSAACDDNKRDEIVLHLPKGKKMVLFIGEGSIKTFGAAHGEATDFRIYVKNNELRVQDLRVGGFAESRIPKTSFHLNFGVKLDQLKEGQKKLIGHLESQGKVVGKLWLKIE